LLALLSNRIAGVATFTNSRVEAPHRQGQRVGISQIPRRGLARALVAEIVVVARNLGLRKLRRSSSRPGGGC
jgi:hypothetical protein